MGCAKAPAATPAVPVAAAGATLTVRDTTIANGLEVAGIAEPLREATLATRLMGSVTEVRVHEGDHVHRGDVLARVDARDMSARAAQATAGLAQADAMHRQALTQAQRFRGLYADSAAPKASLEEAESALARAEAAVNAAHAAINEVDAVSGYATITAPFDGIVSRRLVDVGTFVSPGMPMLTVQDASALRIAVTVSPRDAAGMRRGAALEARIENTSVTATVEGAVPGAGGATYTINAIVPNANGALLAGSSATLRLPGADRRAIVLPEAALVREGELTGVRVRAGATSDMRWLSVSPLDATHVEVRAGLRAGDVVELPASLAKVQ